MAVKAIRKRLGQLLPTPLREFQRCIRNRLHGMRGARRLLRQVREGGPLRIVVGSSGIAEHDWIETDIEYLNLLHPTDWQRYFQPDSITAILAEHVWEHLTPEQGLVAAKICHKYLRPGGHLRIAVPDGHHPDPVYIEQTRPGGTGAGASDHKILYTEESLGAMLTGAGFQVEYLEYFDATGHFHARDWSPAEGMVHRSQRFDERNCNGRLVYTSLLVDAHKRPTSA